jgi:hypothetical protein
MKKRKEDHFFKTAFKVFLYVTIPVLALFLIFQSKITGLTINKEAGAIAGSFLGVILFFFITLLVLIKLRAKAYKQR